MSGLLVGPQEREGVVDALFEDRVGEMSVGQGAGQLQLGPQLAILTLQPC